MTCGQAIMSAIGPKRTYPFVPQMYAYDPSGQFAPFQATQSGWYDCVAWTQGGAHAAARFHHAHRKCGGVATRGRRAANDARHWISKKHAGCAAHLVDAFRRNLGEIGYVKGKKVAIEQRWANNQS